MFVSLVIFLACSKGQTISEFLAFKLALSFMQKNYLSSIHLKLALIQRLLRRTDTLLTRAHCTPLASCGRVAACFVENVSAPRVTLIYLI